MSIHHKVFPYIFLSKHYSFIITFGFLMHFKLIVTGLELVSIYMEYILIIILLFTENVLYLSLDCFGKWEESNARTKFYFWLHILFHWFHVNSETQSSTHNLHCVLKLGSASAPRLIFESTLFQSMSIVYLSIFKVVLMSFNNASCLTEFCWCFVKSLDVFDGFFLTES